MTATTLSTGGKTAWARNLAAPIRSYLHAETGGAIALAGAALRGAGVGEHLAERLRVDLDDAGLARVRLARAGDRPARLGQLRPDDAVLPRRRARGQARAGPRRAARAHAAGDPRGRLARRDDLRRRPLPADQCRRRRRQRLGRGGLVRHGAGARRARADLARTGDPPARIRAHRRRDRRPHLAAGDRARLHRARLGDGADRRPGAVRRAVRAALGRPRGARRRRSCWASGSGSRCSSRASTR